jgi:hypothetical protein
MVQILNSSASNSQGINADVVELSAPSVLQTTDRVDRSLVPRRATNKQNLARNLDERPAVPIPIASRSRPTSRRASNAQIEAAATIRHAFHAVMAPRRQVVPVSGSSSAASAVPRLFWTWLERCTLAGPFRGCLVIGLDNRL